MLIWPWRIKVAFKRLRMLTKPRTTLPLLTACLTERSTTHQRCPSIRPTVWMGMTAVIVVDKGEQARLEVRHRREIAPLQKAPLQDAKPQFHLIKPGTMNWGEMEHMFVGLIREKGFALLACLQVRRNKRDLAHFGHFTTDLQAPVGIEVIQDPVKPFDLRKPVGNMSQVSGEVHALVRVAPRVKPVRPHRSLQ